MSFNVELESGTSVRLTTGGKYCDRDIVVTATGGTGVEPIIQPLEVTENGEYVVLDDVDGYSPVIVNVPIPDGYIVPSGELEVTENGTFDVSDKASVKVNVPTSGGGGEVNTGTCTVKITVPSVSNYYSAYEQVGNDAVSYKIERNYTSGTLTKTVRCDSVMYIQASTIKGAEIADGEVLYLASGYGIAYKTPSASGTSVQVTLSA